MVGRLQRIWGRFGSACHRAGVCACTHTRTHSAHCTGEQESKGGLRVLEWTGSVVPQGALVKGMAGVGRANGGEGGPALLALRIFGVSTGSPYGVLGCRGDGAPTCRLRHSNSPSKLTIPGVKMGWRLLWETFMRELAPQSKGGDYQRPSYVTLAAELQV